MIGSKDKGVILAGAIGNTLEWYDFTIYAFFVPIIAKQFFDNNDPFISLLETFAIFAIGFLVRPLGAILFGYIGDHAGRKKVLVISMVMMSLPTFIIGLIPNYQQIGVYAPLALILLRLLQGLAVSGELTTATVFLIEHANPKRRGLAGSLAMSGALSGMVLSSIFASAVSSLLTDVQLESWGWRIPFLLGGLVGIIGIIIRLKSIDPSLFVEQEKEHISVLQHMKSLNFKIIFIAIILTSMVANGNYFIVGYFNTFLSQTLHHPLRPVMIINTLAIILQMSLTVFMGYISDFVGRKKVLAVGICGMILFVYPLFWLMSQESLTYVLLGEFGFAVLASTFSGVIPTKLAEMFDTHHRNTGISVSYNVALALFGGTAPLIAISLVASTHNIFAPAWYIIVCAIAAFIALCFTKENYKKSF